MSKLDARVIARMAKDRKRRDYARYWRVRNAANATFERRVREEFQSVEMEHASRSWWARLWA